MEELVNKLRLLNKTIATMESCTGGQIATMITNVEGASDVFSFSAVTYSNEFKIKMGVSKEIIDKHSVYSVEVAKEMSKQISLFSDSNYGIGVTGKLNRPDENNLFASNNTVFISIYDKDNDKYYTVTVDVNEKTREENKQLIIDIVIRTLMPLIK